MAGERKLCTIDSAFRVGGSCVAEKEQCTIDRAFRVREGALWHTNLIVT